MISKPHTGGQYDIKAQSKGETGYHCLVRGRNRIPQSNLEGQQDIRVQSWWTEGYHSQS